MSDLLRVTRPDDQRLEQRLVAFGKHECPRDRKHDYLLFPVGLYGSAFPSETPFEVTSMACEGCGSEITVWAEWRGSIIVDLGAAPKRETA